MFEKIKDVKNKKMVEFMGRNTKNPTPSVYERLFEEKISGKELVPSRFNFNLIQDLKKERDDLSQYNLKISVGNFDDEYPEFFLYSEWKSNFMDFGSQLKLIDRFVCLRFSEFDGNFETHSPINKIKNQFILLVITFNNFIDKNH
jgi:hypothetical protein